MSKRENIAGDIITKLDAVTSPIEFKKITREPFEVEELSDAQFPALFVQSGDETRGQCRRDRCSSLGLDSEVLSPKSESLAAGV